MLEKFYITFTDKFLHNFRFNHQYIFKFEGNKFVQAWRCNVDPNRYKEVYYDGREEKDPSLYFHKVIRSDKELNEENSSFYNIITQKDRTDRRIWIDDIFDFDFYETTEEIFINLMC